MPLKSGSELVDNKDSGEKNEVTYDDLLSSAGQLGWYQWRLFLSTCPFFAIGVFSYLSQIFMTEVSPNHWCNIPELATMSDFERRDLGIPKDVNSIFGYSQCTMYDANWTAVLMSRQVKFNNSWDIVPCRHGWEFNKSEIPYPTIGSDLEWVCGNGSNQATAQSMFFIGCILGGIIFGWIADRFGRIPAIVGSGLISCVGGFATTFAKNFIGFSAARFVMGIGFDSCTGFAYLILLEYIGPKYRTLLGNLTFALFFSLFMTLLPWIALACRHWKTFSLVTTLPIGLAIFTKYILPESPMWLLYKNRVDEAIEKVLVIGRINKKEIPKELITQFKLDMSNAECNNTSTSWIEIFRRPVARKMFILVTLEFVIAFIIYDGLVRTIGQLNFNLFVSFSLMSFTEFPSVLLVAFLMDYTGRRWLCTGAMALSSIFCVLIPFNSGKLSILFAMISRFTVNIGLSVAQQWAPELLPTPVRGFGLSLIHIFAFVSIFLCPYIVYLKVYYHWLTFVILGSIAGVGALIPFGLPETAMKAMPNTFEEAEELTKNQRLWTLPFLGTNKKKEADE